MAGELCWFRGCLEVASGHEQFVPGELPGGEGGAENFWESEPTDEQDGGEGGEGDDGVEQDEDDAGGDEGVFCEAEGDVGGGGGRLVGEEACGGFDGVGGEGGDTGEQGHEDLQVKGDVAHDLQSDKDAAERANEGVDYVPQGIEPGDFIGDELHQAHDACNGEHDGVSEGVEQLILAGDL